LILRHDRNHLSRVHGILHLRQNLRKDIARFGSQRWRKHELV